MYVDKQLNCRVNFVAQKNYELFNPSVVKITLKVCTVDINTE